MDDAEKRELTNSYVNLKEHFEMLLRERGAHMDLRFTAMSDALKLAAENIKERLEELNNLRREYTTDRVRDQAQYLDTKIYYPKIKELDDWKEKVDNAITIFKTRYDGRITFSTILSVVSVMVAISSVIVMLWNRGP